MHQVKELSAQCQIEHGLSRSKQNLHHNVFLMSHWELLGKDFHSRQIPFAELKGAFLLKSLYTDWSERGMTDIDVFFREEHRAKVFHILTSYGYQCEKSISDYWTSKKCSFIKPTKVIEVNIEVHFDLFWHQTNTFSVKELKNHHPHSLENQFVHLVGHLAFQHTFLKLFWLKDIHLFTNKYHKQMDWHYIQKKMKSCGFQKSFQATIIACRRIFDEHFLKDHYHGRLPRHLKVLISVSFLLRPRHHVFRYTLLKVLLKDHLKDGVYSLSFFLKSRLKTLNSLSVK